MLTEQDIKAFFTKHNAHPGSKLGIPHYEFKQIIADAVSKDKSFGLFVYRAFKYPENSKRNHLHFDSWSELQDCYKQFMVGFTGNKC